MEKYTPDKFVEFVLKQIVQHPDDVSIQKIESSKEVILEIRVNPSDIGKVIGKSGSVIRSIRTIISALSSKEKKHYLVEVID